MLHMYNLHTYLHYNNLQPLLRMVSSFCWALSFQAKSNNLCIYLVQNFQDQKLKSVIICPKQQLVETNQSPLLLSYVKYYLVLPCKYYYNYAYCVFQMSKPGVDSGDRGEVSEYHLSWNNFNASILAFIKNISPHQVRETHPLDRTKD